jgi:putative membrane protein
VRGVAADRIIEVAPWRSLLLPEAAIVVLGMGVHWFSDHHPILMPWWGPWDFSWPAFLGATWTLLWFWRGHLTSGADRMAGWRVACFLTGLGMIYVVLLTRFEYLSQHMFFLNRIQHAVMHHLGPFLIALSWPGETIACGMPATWRRWCGNGTVRVLSRAVQQPVLAALLFEGLLVLWLVPPVLFRAMFDPLLYAVMNGSMVIDGLLFWFLVLDPRPMPPAPVGFFTRATLAFVIIFPQIALGTLIGTASHDLYPSFSLCGRVFAEIDPLLDQEIGGLILWVPPGMMSALATGLVMRRLFMNETTAVDPNALRLREGLA